MNAVPLVARGVALLAVVLALLSGMGSGLARLGWQMDAAGQPWLTVHGPLMISGFLGTLISLERAVALASRYRWSIVVPFITGVGTIALLIAPDASIGRLFITIGSAGLVALFTLMIRLHPSRDVYIMALGALLWLVGNALWLDNQPIFNVVHLWTAFLILTIVGERLELSRVRRLTRRSEQLLMLSVGIYAAGAALTIIDLNAGVRLLGFGALLMAAWLLRYDVARRTIRQTGLPRYIAACLLAGYVWLGFGGIVAIAEGAVYAGPDYAVILHSFLLGFVFSMIFGHMPIILPALTNLQVTYRPIFYAHLALLHVSLIYRIYGGLLSDTTIRQWGAMFNVAAILLFMAITAVTVIQANLIQPRTS